MDRVGASDVLMFILMQRTITKIHMTLAYDMYSVTYDQIAKIKDVLHNPNWEAYFAVSQPQAASCTVSLGSCESLDVLKSTV